MNKVGKINFGNSRIERVPDTQTLLKVFRIFDKHGLIRDDLCFDPEHFMETVVREHWNDYDI